MRISGLASGFDVDAMVQKMMEAHRAPLDRLKQKNMKIEYQQEAYRSISTAMVDLRNNKLTSLGQTGSINAKKASITGNTTAISATTTSSASSGVYNVQVKELASAASFRVNLGDGGKDAAGKTLAELGYTGTSIVIEDENDATKNVTISYDASTDTLESLLGKINNNKEAKVTALYDSANGVISFTSKVAGNRNIGISGVDIPPAAVTNKSGGSDGIAIVNGVEMAAANNQLTLNGVTIQLQQASTTISTINVSTDSTKILENIKSFISEYNKVLELINGKLGEDRYRNYEPLTDEQRESLSDKQAEMWDEKAKSGHLKNDSILSQAVSNMRIAMVARFGPEEIVNGERKSFNIQSLGITTGNWYEGGKLVIQNEEALLKAIEDDPDKVMQLFTARTADEPATGFSRVNNPEEGIFTRLSNILMDSISSLSKKAGTSLVSTSLTGSFLEDSLLGDQKRNLNSRITDMNRKLSILETRYYKQFTAMETAINKFNSQAGSLASFIG